MITIDQAARHAKAIGAALSVVEHHATRVGDEQLTRALAVLHAKAGLAVVAAETALSVPTGTIHPLGGGDKPPASS